MMLHDLKLPEVKVPPLVIPRRLSAHALQQKIVDIKAQLQAKNAIIIAHYYTPADIQAIAEATGGCVGDSLKMARFGYDHSASTLVVLGVKFMGETAKILNPSKTVLMPTLEATCSLDLCCPIDLWDAFCHRHQDRTVVVYANTSAAIKARADWVVTSANAVDIVRYLSEKGQKILWASDRFLGQYVQKCTRADMVIWPGSCIIHERFKAEGILQLKKIYPHAAVLAHPESPPSVLDIADFVGSTTQLLKAAARQPSQTLIVATDQGLFYKMQQTCPDKRLIAAPLAGQGATCKSCAHCPWMMMNTVERLEWSLQTGTIEVQLNLKTIQQAQKPLKKMIDFKR
jgi:quinolinate synthase